MQLTFRIDEIAVHRRAAFRATTFCAQRVGFSVFTFQHVQHFVFRHQVDGGFATLFRWQRIARTTKEYPGARCANTHFATTGRAVDAGQNHLVRAHTPLFRIFFSFIKLLSEVREEVIQYSFPLCFVISHLVEAVFHLRGKVVVHQFAEIFFKAIGDNFTHFFRVETTIFYSHIATILNGRNDRRIGRRTTDTAFFQLFNQRCFTETGWRLGKVLGWCQFNECQSIAFIDCR